MFFVWTSCPLASWSVFSNRSFCSWTVCKPFSVCRKLFTKGLLHSGTLKTIWYCIMAALYYLLHKLEKLGMLFFFFFLHWETLMVVEWEVCQDRYVWTTVVLMWIASFETMFFLCVEQKKPVGEHSSMAHQQLSYINSFSCFPTFVIRTKFTH